MNGNVYIPYQRFRDLSPACEACAAYWPHILALSAVSMLATPLALLAPVPLQVARGQYSRLPPLRSFITCFYPIDRGPTAFWRSRRGSFQLAFALLDEVPDVTEKPAARPIARARRDRIPRSLVRISGWIAGASGSLVPHPCGVADRSRGSHGRWKKPRWLIC
jgi:hypothetical protein